MAAKTIVVGKVKGGVGKTKVAVMASWELAYEFNKKVLLIDMDPQANATANYCSSILWCWRHKCHNI